MNHYASPRFWRCYRGLPDEICKVADRNYALLKADPTHNSLHFKKIASLWSVRVGLHYRLARALSSAPSSSSVSMARRTY